MSEPIKPATDEEIATIGAWNCDCRFNAGADRHTKDCFLMFGPRLVARIQSDAAKIKSLELERDTIQEYATSICAEARAIRAGQK